MYHLKIENEQDGLKARDEYIKYIQDHISNMKKAFNLYALPIVTYLDNCNLNSLKYRISVHDKSKFSEEEFEPYRKRFYPANEAERLTDDDPEFLEAWKHHYTENSHHPEHFSDGEGGFYEMPDIDIAEMLLDWFAMGMTHNSTPWEYYYSSDKPKMFHPATKIKLEAVLNKLSSLWHKGAL